MKLNPYSWSKWFELYPEFQSNLFYISGESYAGIYIPTLTDEVVKGIEKGLKPRINLKGYLIGNGATDKDYDFNSFVPFAHGMGLISTDLFELGGVISPSIGKLDKLQRIALHQNSLHGLIPAEIKNCTELRAIYLRVNYLQGSIPSEIGELIHLTILDLSSNLLRGTIPASIGSLTHLRFLNLSTNS